MRSKKPPRNRRPTGSDWVAGPNAVVEVLRAGRRKVHELRVTESALRRRQDLQREAQKAQLEFEITTLAKLDESFDGIRHQGVIAKVGPYPYVEVESLVQPELGGHPLLLAIDQVTDPHNFGAIVRSAVAFGVRGVLITKDRCAEVNATTVRTSAGATEHANIAKVTNLARALKQLQTDGFEIVGLAGEGATDLGTIARDRPRVLVVGSEGDGLRRLTRESCDILAQIPIDASIASLNASVAAAVALYALREHDVRD